jgi:hypothetical protein
MPFLAFCVFNAIFKHIFEAKGHLGFCNTKKERDSGVSKFDFLNRCFDGRSETADVKI